MGGAVDVAPNVGAAVSSFRYKDFRSLPAFLFERADVGPGQRHYRIAVQCVPQHAYRWCFGGGPGVQQIAVVVREGGLMMSCCWRQVAQLFAIEANAVIVDVVRIFVGLDASGSEDQLAIFLIYMVHPAYHPLAGSNGPGFALWGAV